MRLVSDAYLHRLMSGEAQGVGPSVFRGIARVAEYFYAMATRHRNVLYDKGILPTYRMDVPVISIGNITAGGTGKTPFVRKLAAAMADRGCRPAILMRGYRRSAGGISDEQALLAEQLKDRNIPVHAEPDRVAGARHVLAKHKEVNTFILDDGFQHRRLARDVDIVLIDATNPFGHGHVHPRGLLREPLSGLARASCLIITRCEQVAAGQLEQIESELRRYARSAPILRTRFQHSGLRSASISASASPDILLADLRSKKIFAAAGIANPHPLESSLRTLTNHYLGDLFFPDHHDFTAGDVAKIISQAAAAHADAIVITEKDWTKIRTLPGAIEAKPSILRLDLEIDIENDDEQRLSDLITGGLSGNRPMNNGTPQSHEPRKDDQRQHHPDAAP
jgi:tetraacyldisaccharide 4'-kinase